MTETELSVMATLAIIGLSRMPDERIERPGGDRHAEGVVEEGEREVLADIGHGGPAEPAGADDAAEVAPDQGDAGALHGDVGAGPHRDADVAPGRGPARR